MENKVIPPITTLQSLEYNSILTPELFEKFCLRIFNENYGHLNNIRTEGVPGMEQYGIDIYGYNGNSCKYVVAQCKQYNNITKSQISKIIEKFENGKYRDKCDVFIISTSCPLNDTEEKEAEIKRLIEEFSKKKIELLFWDNVALDLMLKDPKYINIVFDFFDAGDEPTITNRFYGKSNLPVHRQFKFKKYKLPTNYVPRILTKIQSNQSIEFNEPNQQSTLIDILKNNGAKKIFIKSDAGFGKTTELESVASYFSHKDKSYLPVLKLLKDYNKGTVEEILNKEVSDWKKIDFRNILLILDGFDEIEEINRKTLINSIEEFSRDHPQCSILISCRSNFIESVPIKDFDIWELNEFDENSIRNYVNLLLECNEDIDAFMSEINSKNLLMWLKNPFILSYYVKCFQNNPEKLPNSRKELFKQVVDRFIEIDQERGDFLEENKEVVFKMLQKLSFGMNLWGTKKISNEEFIELFPDNHERQILKKSSLTIYRQGIKFIHNNFQEYFTALTLSELNYSQIREIICFNNSEKIKPKWFNTISILIDIYNHTDDFNELLILIINNQPTLLFSIEYKALNSEIRFKIFKSILELPERQFKQEIYFTNKLSEFGGINENDNIINFIINNLENPQHYEITELIYMLRGLNKNNFFGHKKRLLRVLKEIAQKNDNLFSWVITTLTILELFDEEIEELVINEADKTNLYNRLNLCFSILNINNLANEYPDLYIKGIELLKERGKRNIIDGIEDTLLVGLCQFNTLKSISKLLDYLINSHSKDEFNDTIQEIYESSYWGLKFSSKKTPQERYFIAKFVENIINVYKEHPSIEKKFTTFYKKIYVNSPFVLKYLSEFFKIIGSSEKVFFNLLCQDDSFSSLQKCSFLLEKKYVRKIFKLYKSKKIEAYKAMRCVSAFESNNDKDSATQLLLLLHSIDENNFKIENKKVFTPEEKHQNDLALLSNQEKFIEKVTELFKDFGENELTPIQIFGYKNSWQETDNNIIRDFLGFYLNDEILVLNKVLDFISDSNNWMNFFLNQCIKYLESKKVLNTEIIQKINIWCLENIESCDFSNALSVTILNPSNKSIQTKKLEKVVTFFFENLELNIPENTILEMLNYDMWGIYASSNNQKKLSEIVIDRIDNLEKVKLQIIKNLEQKQSIDDVILTQILICNKYKFYEAMPLILEFIKSQNSLSRYEFDKVIETFLVLGGEISALEFVFDDFDLTNEHHLLIFNYFSKRGSHNTNIRFHLNNIDTSSISTDLCLQIIHILLNVGSNQGLIYLQELINNHNYSFNSFFDFSGVEKIPIDESINTLITIFNICLNRINFKTQNNEFDTHFDISDYQVILEQICRLGLNTFNYPVVKSRLEGLCDENINNPKLYKELKISVINLEKEYYQLKTDFVSFKEVTSFLKKHF